MSPQIRLVSFPNLIEPTRFEVSKMINFRLRLVIVYLLHALPLAKALC